jgi:hypothetical protein
VDFPPRPGWLNVDGHLLGTRGCHENQQAPGLFALGPKLGKSLFSKPRLSNELGMPGRA